MDFKDYFKYSLLDNENDFNRIYLGDFINKFYDNHVDIDKIPFSLYLVELLPYVGRILTLNQVHIVHSQQQNKKIPINCYSLAVFKSGGGKGYIKSILDGLFSNYTDFELKKVFDARCCQLIQEAHNNPDYNAVQLKQAIRDLKIEFQGIDSVRDITRAGIRNLGETLKKFDKPTGGVFIYIDEFAKYLNSAKNNDIKNDFISAALEISELGQLEGTILAKEKFEGIKFLPVNMLMATTGNRLMQGDLSKEFIDMLIDGWARRLLIAYPLNDTMSKENSNDGLMFEDPKLFLQLNKSNWDVESYNSLKLTIDLIIKNSYDRTELYLSDECWELVELYRHYCEYMGKKQKEGSLIQIELLNRHWKALKLVGIIHAIDSKMNNSLISIDEYRKAVYIVEYFSYHLNRLVLGRVYTDIDFLLDVFKDNLDKEIGLNDIYQNPNMRNINLKYKQFTTWFRENIIIIKQELERQGYQLKSKNFKYKLIIKPNNEL